MEPIVIHTGIAAMLLRDNIDTDAIIPSREMKRVSKKGLGEGLFAGWRYTLPGGREPNPDFILNQAPYEQSSILLGGHNLGCGSPREHAVWALYEYGFRVIVASSYGSIFYSNCIRNGILPVALNTHDILHLADYVQQDPSRHKLRIDLQSQQITCTALPNQPHFHFDIGHNDKIMLLEGLDSIALTMKQAEDIKGFIDRDRKNRPWAYFGARSHVAKAKSP